MRKLATAFIVALTLLTHSLIAEDRDIEVNAVTVVTDLNNPESERGYFCEVSMAQFLNRLVNVSSRMMDTKNQWVDSLSRDNLLKDYDLFEQYNKFKEYTASINKDLEIPYNNVVNKVISIADEVCVEFTGTKDNGTTEFYEASKSLKVKSLTEAKDLLLK